MRRCILFLAVWLALPGWAAAQPSTLARLEVFPASRVLHAPHATQQLAVIAHFTNGVKQDVTRLTTFISSDAEVATINGQGQVRFWEPGEVAILCRYHKVQSITLTYVDPKPGFVWPDPPQHNGIDRLVFGKLNVLNLPPSDLCSDPVFVRRAYLDLCGLRPTPHEVKRFLADERVDRRKWLIDELLER
ncbi:MAG: DUF1549 domain-containing protein, partial [Planctomycetes bacterium]|nr:DUF1549 domain-containing protein [Planctomycetota bacterium]